MGRKDSTKLTQTDKNGNERNLSSTLMMSSRPPYDCDTDFGVRNDGSNGCIVHENMEKSSSKSTHSSGTAFSDTNFGDEEYAQMKKYGHCFKFVKFGACTRKFCKFVHVNRNLSYPNHSNFIFGKSKTDIGKDRTSSTPRKTFRSGDGQGKQHGRPICFNFKNKGFCRYGSQCKYSHVFNSRSAGRQDFNQRFTSAREERSNNLNYNTESTIVNGSFLREVRSLLDPVKTIVESHKQSNPVVFTVPQYQNVPVVSQVPDQGHQPWLPHPGLVQQ